MKERKEWRPLPDSITIKDSKIEGLGVFATQNIPENTDLGISHVYDERFPDNYIRLPLGAFINHHEMPYGTLPGRCSLREQSEEYYAKRGSELSKTSHFRIVFSSNVHVVSEPPPGGHFCQSGNL